jgi:hypothetical protein
LESKIASLEKEMKRLKCLSASFEYETSLWVLLINIILLALSPLLFFFF